MSTPNIFPQTGYSISELDRRIMDGLQNIRDDVKHLLKPSEQHQASAGDHALGMHTVKTTADTTWQLSEKQKLWAETERLKARTAELIAEEELIKARKT